MAVEKKISEKEVYIKQKFFRQMKTHFETTKCFTYFYISSSYRICAFKGSSAFHFFSLLISYDES